MEKSEFISIGPFGGLGGQEWDDGTYTTVRQMKISYGDVINSIQVEYDKSGQFIWSEKHGGSGSKEAMVKLDYPREFLTNISGYYIEDSSVAVIQSLTIQSNYGNKYGPYGQENGTYFSTTSAGGKIIGFFGSSDVNLNSIGAYFYTTGFLSVGPFGGPGGHTWDDGTYTTIRQMNIAYGEVIDSIRTEYDQSGQSKWSEQHGGSGGGVEVVKLDYPSEYLKSISGYVNEEYSSTPVVGTLIIQSNIRQYGPFGNKQGKYFSTSTTGGKIVGFFGRCGKYLDSIGAYFEPL